MKLAGGIVLILIGIVWILQGFDVSFAPQSFMTDDRQWVLWGSVTVIAGSVLLWLWRRDQTKG
jgi:hypothetical protein